MADGRLGAALRITAIAIAVVAVFDPVFTVSRSVPQSVVVARMASNTAGVEAAIRSALPGTDVSIRPAINGRLPCVPAEPCVMVADGSLDVDIPEDLAGPVSLIRVGVAAGANVSIQSVAASRAQHSGGAGTVRVTLRGVGMRGRRTDVRVADGAATVGSASHEWAADGEAAIDIPWWPLGEGPRALRVAAMPFDGEMSSIDNAVNVGVTVSSNRVPVLLFDARPSWASTFVRRALEDDPRFQVEHRVGLGPAMTAGTAGGRLDARALDTASIAIVGSLEALSSGEVALLDRFVRVRGGTLILLPDRAPAGAAARLFTGRWTERLEASASAVGPLRASETLRLGETSALDVTLGSVQGSPAIVLSPAGRGRIVVSGAMDAWRFRDSDDGAFDRFWRSLVLESAADSAPLRLDFDRAIAAPGSEVPFMVRYRQMDASAPGGLTATATCGDRPARVVRLWPAGASGEFTGVLGLEGRDPCEVRVAVNEGPSVVGGIAVTDSATQTVSAVLAKLERAAARTGGVVADAGDESGLAATLDDAVARPRSRHSVHPMRSPWWVLPFVTCLSLEWWLRRRIGLR